MDSVNTSASPAISYAVITTTHSLLSGLRQRSHLLVVQAVCVLTLAGGELHPKLLRPRRHVPALDVRPLKLRPVCARQTGGAARAFRDWVELIHDCDHRVEPSAAAATHTQSLSCLRLQSSCDGLSRVQVYSPVDTAADEPVRSPRLRLVESLRTALLALEAFRVIGIERAREVGVVMIHVEQVGKLRRCARQLVAVDGVGEDLGEQRDDPRVVDELIKTLPPHRPAVCARTCAVPVALLDGPDHPAVLPAVG